MSSRRRVLLVLFFLVPVSLPSFAFQESLSFRRAADGGFEAVVSGLSDGPSCETEFVPPSDLQVANATITITSPYESYACSIPQTAVPYQIVADLGQLPSASYEVTWTEGPLELTGILVPGGIGVVFAAPAVSFLSLAAMTMLLIAFAFRSTRRKADLGR